MNINKINWKDQVLNGQIPPRFGGNLVFLNNTLHQVGQQDPYNPRICDFYSLNLSDWTWTKQRTSGNSCPKTGAQAVVFKNRILYFGGSNDPEQMIFLDDLLEFNLSSQEWRIIPTKDSPQGRVDHSLSLYKESIFLFGGRANKKVFNDLRLFNITSEKWRTIQCDQVPSFRFGHQTTIYEDTIILTGGCNGFTVLQEVWLFLINQTQWIKAECKGVPPQSLFRHQCAIANREHLIFFGGCTEDGKQLSNNLYALNLVNFSWIQLPFLNNMPTARIYHTLIALSVENREELLVCGGFNETNLRDIKILNFNLIVDKINLGPQVGEVLGYINSIQNSSLFLPNKEEFIQEIKQKDVIGSQKSILSDFLVNHNINGNSFIEIKQQYEWKEEECQGNIFTPRTGHSVVAVFDQLYLFCGSDNENILNDMYVFDIRKKYWSLVPSKGAIPHPRSGCKGVQMNQDIYYFGGYTFRKGEYFNDCYKFNVKSNQWTYYGICKEISPRVDHTLVQNGKYLYIFGGSDGKNKFDDFYRIEVLQSLQVTRLNGEGNVPSARFGHSAEVYRNSMYIFGGWNGTDTLDELYTYSFLSNFWSNERIFSGNKPPARYRHASAVLGNSMFIFGGVDKNQTRFDDLFEFNFERREWRSIETWGNNPTARTFHQLVSFETKLYLVGGNDGTKKTNDLYSINVLDQMYSEFSSLPDLDDDRRTLTFYMESKTDHINFKKVNDKDMKVIKVMREQVMELSQRLKQEQEYNLCKLCKEREINSVFLNCAHRCCCYNCSIKINVCQICFKNPTRILKIFTV